MIDIPLAIGILAIAGLLVLVGWMLMRVPDPKHAIMLEMLWRMEHAPDVFVRHPHHAQLD